MKKRSTNRERQSEAGIALLISIFVLLLISVVAIALVVSSGTETALAGNYRSSTGVYYAALSGLEEARGRLFSKDPDAFKTTNPTNFLPPSGTALNMGDTYYLINPVGGEAVTPWDSSSTYSDKQFQAEFTLSGFNSPTNPSPRALSVWNRNPLQALNLPGPLYKWVRINAVSEKSLGIDVDADNQADSTTPLYFDGVRFSNSPSAGPQVLELTAFATLPNGSQKLLQYLIARRPIVLPPFLAALTLSGSPGNGVTFHAPSSNSSYSIKGIDRDCSGNPPPAGQNYPAIGLLTNSNSDIVHVTNGIPNAYWPNYTGVNNPGPDVPDVEDISSTFAASAPNLQTPSQLDAMVQTIVQNADVVINPGVSTSPPYTAHWTDLDGPTSGMSSSSTPLTIAVTGNLDITGWGVQGYGLLLVTGTFTYDPDTNWDGIILVIGQGAVNGSATTFANEINGAMFVARTRNSGGNLLPDPNLQGASVVFADPMNGFGIRYSSCWIQKAQPKSGYAVLSFHEISSQ